MKNNFKAIFYLVFILFYLFPNFTFCQKTFWDHVWFQPYYKLTQRKIDKWKFQLTQGDTPLHLCEKIGAFINVSGGKITVDIFQLLEPITCESGITQKLKIKDNPIYLTDNRTSLGDPTNVLILPYRAVSLGINTMPIRVRPQFDSALSAFSLALSYGQTYGWGFITTRGIVNYTITPGFFIGPSTTGNFLDAAKISHNLLVISKGFQLVLARNSLGFNIAYGWDNALGSSANKWAYQGKWWFGFGVSASLSK